ncbi:Histone H2B [Platanthera zijinensis]|uniref:Histone H2B n=1 Tax=Platanthera zijinensis TaxID=2320716 RepID=A0AAP0B2R5_9ASPA
MSPEAEKKVEAAETTPAGKQPTAEKKNVEDYRIYILEALKEVYPGIGISSKTLSIINSVLNDIFEKISQEAPRDGRYGNKPATRALDLQAAVSHVLPGELGKLAVSEATTAAAKLTSS